MSDLDEALQAVFQEFCMFGMGSKVTGPPLMDSRQCQKLARDCGIIDRHLTKADVDLVFTAVKARGERRIDYLDFLECVRQWAERKGITYEELCEHIANSNGPTLNQVTTPDAHKFTSPLYEATPAAARARATPPSSSDRRHSASKQGGLSSARLPQSGALPASVPVSSLPLHPDWYEVENPDPQGPDELIYYVNRKTNETSWARPVLISPPKPSRVSGAGSRGGSDLQESEFDLSATGSVNSHGSDNSPHRSVFDKLTDHSLFTGTHKHRFDPQTGQGLGRRGRDAASKGLGTPAKDSPTAFRGFTNTGTDEVIHDISQIVIRK